MALARACTPYYRRRRAIAFAGPASPRWVLSKTPRTCTPNAVAGSCYGSYPDARRRKYSSAHNKPLVGCMWKIADHRQALAEKPRAAGRKVLAGLAFQVLAAAGHMWPHSSRPWRPATRAEARAFFPPFCSPKFRNHEDNGVLAGAVSAAIGGPFHGKSIPSPLSARAQNVHVAGADN
jgi:hypothetical protein